MLDRIRLILCTAVCVLSASISSQAAPPDNAAGVKFFEERIRPLLVESCISCHGAEKQKGGLRLDSREAALKGGDSGAAVVPGNTESGYLLDAVSYTGDFKMPPKGKLAPRQIADLKAWVKLGAPWPASSTTKSPSATAKSNAATAAPQKDHWAFLPVTNPAPPTPGDKLWGRTPIDQFVLAMLESQDLRPAPPADKRTLIRRAYFDLLGLPPTPEQVDAFIRDVAPNAFDKVIDQLLSSPQYGERWGRHWLDVARYADSNGMDENLSYANAWKYRDWVIKAFNSDLPYDQFVREQVAGDLLSPQSSEAVIPTGFLMIGPKMLAEDDPVKMHMDIVDEQLDTLGQAFMGMTLGCARCHDHKFDPLPTRDYYALAGIFKSTKTMDTFTVVAQWQERTVASGTEVAKSREHEARIDAVKQEIAKLENLARQDVLQRAKSRAADYLAAAEEVRKGRTAKPLPLMSAATPPAGAIVVEAESYENGNVLKDRDNYGKAIGVVLNAGPLPNFTEYTLTVPADGEYQLQIRYAALEPRPVKVTVNGKQLGETALQVTGGWFADKQAWESGPAFALKSGTVSVRLECARVFPHIDKLALVPVPPGQALPVRSRDLAVARDLVPKFLDQWVAYLDRVGKAISPEQFGKVVEAADGPFALGTSIDEMLSPQAVAQRQQLRQQLEQLEKSRPVLPTAMAVSEGKPGNLRVHIRGNHLTLGAEVPRGFPVVLSPPQQSELRSAGSGRKELAEWMTRRDHPLTARVAVNRLWTWHFGEGLVRTPDNFGRLGDLPVHRELLDWLATRFISDGWSIKKMHRLIMSSAVYQMSTTFDAAADRKDPENRWHWRWNRQRLDAESFRDALLSLSGMLDETVGGNLLTVPNRKYVTSTANVNYKGYDSNRRSVYLPVIRSAGYEPFQSFDFPDPSVPKGHRSVTTVPAQSLVLMNSQLVQKHTRKLAARILGQPGDDASRMQRLWQLVFARPMDIEESRRATEFLRQYELAAVAEKVPAAEVRTRAWQGLCRALISSNEFIYVE